MTTSSKTNTKAKKEERIKCVFCKRPIHIDKWGGVIKEGFFCTNIFCLLDLVNKLEK